MKKFLTKIFLIKRTLQNFKHFLRKKVYKIQFCNKFVADKLLNIDCRGKLITPIDSVEKVIKGTQITFCNWFCNWLILLIQS